MTLTATAKTWTRKTTWAKKKWIWTPLFNRRGKLFTFTRCKLSLESFSNRFNGKLEGANSTAAITVSAELMKTVHMQISASGLKDMDAYSKRLKMNKVGRLKQNFQQSISIFQWPILLDQVPRPLRILQSCLHFRNHQRRPEPTLETFFRRRFGTVQSGRLQLPAKNHGLRLGQGYKNAPHQPFKIRRITARKEIFYSWIRFQMGSHDLIGQCEVTLGSLQSANSRGAPLELVNPKKRKGRTGLLSVDSIRVV